VLLVELNNVSDGPHLTLVEVLKIGRKISLHIGHYKAVY
jgi:hypothetical protein